MPSLDAWELDDYGVKGWELVSVIESRSSTRYEPARYDYIFKRECGVNNDSVPSS